MPFDGDAFFTSVMTPAWPAAILARMLASKPRRSARNSALASTSSRRLAKPRCFFAAATSSALTARILLRMSDMMAPDKKVSKSSVLFCEREPQAECQEQAAGDAVQPQRHARLELEPVAGEGREHGQRITPQHAVEIEDATKEHEGQRLAVRVGRNKLRHEGEEENRHLRIQHIGQKALEENFAIRERRQRGRSSGLRVD